jgi:hypothetical protein
MIQDLFEPKCFPRYNHFIKKIGDSEEEDVIFICVQDIVTKEKSF